MSDPWPDDADGAVFRSLQADGFDFGRPCMIDFVVEFDSWPPAPEAVRMLEELFESVISQEDDETGAQDVEAKLHGLLTYELVTRVQDDLSRLMEPFGGHCECWGVLHRPS